MARGINISDKNAWDDSFLQDSWNDAVAEYEVGSLLLPWFLLPNLGSEVP